MIQRLQTLLLFLAAAANISLLFLPIWLVTNVDMDSGATRDAQAFVMKIDYKTSQMSIDNPFTETTISFTEDTIMIVQFVLVVLASLLLLGAIFLFNNRQLQRKVALAGIVTILLQFLPIIRIRSLLEEMCGAASPDPDLYQSIPQYGLAGGIIALLLAWWATKRIQKDEKMVRDMDRIR